MTTRADPLKSGETACCDFSRTSNRSSGRSMARLNIESSLWTNPRFQLFMIKIGDRHRAIGMLVDLWTLAQQYWCPAKDLIPFQTWTEAGLSDELIECGLAERRDLGIYARGSESHFQWWFDGIEQRKNAGKKRASTGQRDTSGRWKVDGNKRASIGDRSINETPAGTSAIQPSSSPSSSKRKKSVEPSDTTRLWDFYSSEVSKNGIQAIHGGAKTNALCQRLVKGHGLEKAKELILIYLADHSGFVTEKAWTLGLLVSQQQEYLAKTQSARLRPVLNFGDDL
jgi:hypothetical protein